MNLKLFSKNQLSFATTEIKIAKQAKTAEKKACSRKAEGPLVLQTGETFLLCLTISHNMRRRLSTFPVQQTKHDTNTVLR